MKNEVDRELSLTGTPIGNGMAIGKLFFLESFEENTVPEFSISGEEVENEVQRYREAILSSREGLHDLRRFLARDGGTQVTSIVDTHMEMLNDPWLTALVEGKIRELKKNTEAVFCSVMKDYEKKFSQIQSELFEHLLSDVRDVAQRVLRNLSPRKPSRLGEIPQDAIIFTKELIPSKVAELSPENVKGFITEMGGAMSHAALIACSKGFPYVTNIEVETLYPYRGATVIVDGKAGKIIVHPSAESMRSYLSQKTPNRREKTSMVKAKPPGVVTKDGYQVQLLANVESLDDVDVLHIYGAQGVGLFRSEFFFLSRRLEALSEEEQYLLYREVISRAKGKPVTFRLFDVGGDKGQVYGDAEEPNPALGSRAIRFLLSHRGILIRQLRALLRVSSFGVIHLLLPLVSDIGEVVQTKKMMERVIRDLREEEYVIADRISFGAMIEVPAMAMMADLLIREVDFVAIGTNDLTQYALAADRTNRHVDSFYRPYHPAVMRMVSHIVEAVRPLKKPVSLCGEIASNVLMVPLLLGLGIRQFSCAPRFLLKVRKMIESISFQEADAIARKMWLCSTESAVVELLEGRYAELAASFADP